MAKRFLIVLRHAPYGRIDAAEAVRHLNGAGAGGLESALLLIDDGVYLAKAGQVAAPGWTELATELGRSLGMGAAEPRLRARAAVYVHAPSLQVRGIAALDLVPGCRIIEDAATADLVVAADATLVY